MEKLIFRVDASPYIGTGHLMRCLALGQAWKDAKNEAIFITSCQNKDLLKRLQEESFDIHLISKPYPDPSDWDHTRNIINHYPTAWIVLDGYYFDENYQRRIKESEHNLIVIDDLAHLKHYYADFLLNQNIHADKLDYSCEPYTRLLLGTKYILLRREFSKWNGWKREIPKTAKKVLLTMGGSDRQNYTEKVLLYLKELDLLKIEITVIVGASNPNFKKIQQISSETKIATRVFRNIIDMAELMAWADIAISSGGTTLWELAFMGLPSFLIAVAENQRFSVDKSVERGYFFGNKSSKDIDRKFFLEKMNRIILDRDLREKSSLALRSLVDGRGASRVAIKVNNYKNTP